MNQSTEQHPCSLIVLLVVVKVLISRPTLASFAITPSFRLVPSVQLFRRIASSVSSTSLLSTRTHTTLMHPDNVSNGVLQTTPCAGMK